MDYKELAEDALKSAQTLKSISSKIDFYATAITDLLELDKKNERIIQAAENALEQSEKYYDQMVDALAATDSAELEETKQKLKAAEKQIEAFSMFALGNTVTVSGNREVITFCGVSCDEAMERVTDYPQLKMRLERAEKALSKLQSILYDPLIIEQNGVLRPVKRTSRQDVYKTVLAAQAAAGITGRWFPKWMKEE